MNKGFATLLAFCAVAALATSSVRADGQPAPFSYRVKAPAGSASCADHAAGVAASFAAGTRAQRVTGACESRQTIVDQGASYAIDVMVINYLATSELTPTRSVFGANAFMNNGEQGAGVFKTYAECLDQLAAQRPIFIAETGLTPVVSYCLASTQTEFYPGYTLTFETFGALKHQLFTYSEDGIGVPTDDHSQVIHAAVLAIQEAGGHIAWSNASRVFYYNDGYLNISSQNLGMFEDDSQQCVSQLPQAKAIFVAAGLVGVTAFCRTDMPVPGHSFSVLLVVGAGPNEVTDMDADRYDTFSECMGDLNRVLKNATSSGRSVFGGLCSPNLTGANGFNAHVFFGYN